jgi:hypothetical protein
VAVGGAVLEAGAGTPEPLAGARDDAGASSGGGDTATEPLADGCDDDVDDVAVFCAGRPCGDVQPASTSVRTPIVGATLLVIRHWAFGALADITNSLWPPHMTKP